jgi:hypothetical protein
MLRIHGTIHTFTILHPKNRSIDFQNWKKSDDKKNKNSYFKKLFAPDLARDGPILESLPSMERLYPVGKTPLTTQNCQR